MNSEDCRKYFKSLNKYRTNLSVVENAVGEGITEGRYEKTIEIAKNAKNMGMEASVISNLQVCLF